MYTQAFAGAGRAPQPVTFSDPIDVGAAYVTPPQGRVFFVCGDGTTVTNLDDQYSQFTTQLERQRFASVALALAECKASRGDTIFVHPSHTENITADAWPFVAGVKIIGLGQGNTRPTFTFTVATSTLLLDVAAISIQNCRFLLAGPAGSVALTVTAPIVVTGEGCSFIGNFFQTGIDANQLCTTPFTIKGANCAFYGNRILALAAAAPSTNVIVLGDADEGADGFTFVGNYVKAATGAVTTGLIANITSTATSNDIVIENNYLHNWLAVSQAVISFAGDMVTTGVIRKNTFRVELNSDVEATVTSGTGVDVTLDDNGCCNVANETAKQNQGTVSA